jgi:PadR family transcriptional regulator, regulatory protein PadR
MRKMAEYAPEIGNSEEYDCKRYIDKIIKTNREIFIMSSLLEKPMCGYDIIKEIFLKCNVFLSQGTVYPVLYSLEEEGILYAEYSKGDMRSKKYSLTLKGKDIAQKNIDEFVKSINHLTFLIQR